MVLFQSRYIYGTWLREAKSREGGKNAKDGRGGAIIKRAGDLPSRHQGLASLPTFSVISASLLSIPS